MTIILCFNVLLNRLTFVTVPTTHLWANLTESVYFVFLLGELYLSLSHKVLWRVCTKMMLFRTDLTFSLNLDWSVLLDCWFRDWYLTMILWVCVPSVVGLQRLCFDPVMNGDQPSVNPMSPLLTARALSRYWKWRSAFLRLCFKFLVSLMCYWSVIFCGRLPLTPILSPTMTLTLSWVAKS